METDQILGAKVRVRRFGAVAVMAAAGLLVSACGQKGPLYLPAPGAMKSPSSASSQAGTEASSSQEDEEPVTKR